MGLKSQGYKFFIGIFLLTANIAQAADPAKREPIKPFNLNAKYTIAWNGIPIGRINLTAKEDQAGYSLIADTKASGIASLFSDERRIAEAEGTIANGHYIPRSYASRPQKEEDDDARVTTLAYDAHGKLSERSRVPDDDPNWRPPVTAKQVGHAPDPVTAGLVLRRNLYEALAQKDGSVASKSYDGARLAEMRFSIVKHAARVEVMGQYQQAITTIVTRQPITGYTPKELKAFNKGDPIIRLYFSNDAAFLPVRAAIDARFGELSATLTKINE